MVVGGVDQIFEKLGVGVALALGRPIQSVA